jgi:hypothetical protein
MLCPGLLVIKYIIETVLLIWKRIKSYKGIIPLLVGEHDDDIKNFMVYTLLWRNFDEVNRFSMRTKGG